MTGNELKGKIYQNGFTQKEIAIKLDTTSQSLSSVFKAQDVRSGTIEKIAEAMNVPVSYLYGETSGNAVAKEHSIAAVNSKVEGASMAARIDLLERLLEEKERMIQEKERTIKILLNKEK